MITTKRIKSALTDAEWLRAAFHEKELSATARNRAAIPCLLIAQQHHHSIVLLIGEKLYASAYALLRSSLESYVRGMWLALCASDEEVKEFWAGQIPPNLKHLIRRLEHLHAFTGGTLSKITKEFFSELCDFTHTGGQHVQRWNATTHIEPTYEPEEIAYVLSSAENIGVLAVIGTATILNNVELARSVYARVSFKK
jgi:hypothetical protein